MTDTCAEKDKSVDRVVCPFCAAPIKGELPEGLELKEMIKIFKRILKEAEKDLGK